MLVWYALRWPLLDQGQHVGCQRPRSPTRLTIQRSMPGAVAERPFGHPRGEGQPAAVPAKPVLGDAEPGGSSGGDEKSVLAWAGPVDPQGEPRPQDRPEALRLPEEFGEVVEIDLGGKGGGGGENVSPLGAGCFREATGDCCLAHLSRLG